MLFYLIPFFFELITTLVALVFAIIAYNNRKQNAYFYLAIGFEVLAIILLAPYYEFLLGTSLGWFIIMCIAVTITFIILSKISTNSTAETLTDAFPTNDTTLNEVPSLDEIINGPDEEWDPESTIERQKPSN